MKPLHRSASLWLVWLVALPLAAQPPRPGLPGQPVPGGPPQVGQPLLKPGAKEALRSGKFSMNYENLDLRVLARMVSELTGRNLVLDEGVQGKVTLLASSQLTSEELWEIFQGLLAKNGFGLRRSGDIYQVMVMADVRRNSRNSSLAVVLREGDANQLVNAIRPILTDANSIQVYGPGKSLVVHDDPRVLAEIVRLTRAIDRATPRVKVETLFLQYAESEKLAPLLQQVITRTMPIPGQHQPVVAAFPPTNALLIQATPEALKELRQTVEQLDVPKSAPLTVEKPRYFVYKLQNGNSDDVSKILADLLRERQRAIQEEEARRGRQAAGSSAPPPVVNASPGPSPAQANLPGQFQPQAGPAAAPQAAIAGKSEQQLSYVGARVGNDPEINAVLVYVSPSEYPSIRSLLGMLDRKRKQILVHAMVAEVSLSKLLEAGSRLQLFDSTGPVVSYRGGASEEGLLSFLTSGQFLVGATSGSTRTINVGGRDVRVPTFFGFLTGNRQNRDFDLISSPRLVATDHKEAEMKVGNVVPFATGARFSQVGQPVVTYDYKDVGIRLKFVPHVSQGKTIRIELEQEIQEVTEFLEQNLGGFGYIVPLISNRLIKTDVNLRDGETLLIGGLISKRTTETVRKVPILGDIPLIQNLFRELRKEEEKTSLFVALTPYLVEGPDDIARIDEAYAQFMASEGLPNQAQSEPRDTQLSRQAVGDPYAANPQDPKPMLDLSSLRVEPPSQGDRLRQPRVQVRNQDRQVEAEVQLHLKVLRPDQGVEEMLGPRVRLAPGESREVLIDPYPFPDQPGSYRFQVQATVGDRRVGQSPTTEVEAP